MSVGTEPSELNPFGYDDDDGSIADPKTIGDQLRGLFTASGKAEPFYPRLLRLKNVHPNGWQRAALVEGMVILGALVALADKATAWAPLFLPIATAVVVKFHDVVAGLLPARPRDPEPFDGDGFG